MLPNPMANKRPTKLTGCSPPFGDCESSLSMKIKCRRVHLTAVFTTLMVLFAFSSTFLHVQYQRKAMSSESESPGLSIQTNSKRRSHQFHNKQAQVLQAPFKIPKANNPPRKQSGQQAVGKNTDIHTTKKQKKKALMKKRDKGPPLLQEREMVQPISSSLSKNATFAACLLIKDDNEILPEWLAYHYHVIGLRHLIVAVDPLSVEYPSQILERWRSLTDMKIQEWMDDDYMPSDFLVYQKPPEKYVQNTPTFVDLSAQDILEISNHRYRQRVFLAKCMKQHRDDGNSWVMHIDTDEYVVASKLLRQMKPDHLTIPPMDQPSAVLDLLQQAVRKTPQQVSYPCISMLRVLFGSVESSQEEIFQEVPPEFDAKHFESLRWRYHALPHNMTMHGNPKVILDVSAIPDQRFPQDIVFSIHRPVEAYCHRNKEVSFTSFRKQPIAVNHYLGSWERYTRRNDKRRSRAVYEAKANVRRGKDDGNRLWLQGFVKQVGLDLAMRLLGDNYLVRDYPSGHNQALVE